MDRPDFPGGIWFGDFEFHPATEQAGNPPVPVCLVAHDIVTGVTHRCWQDELANMPEAPFLTDASALFIAYNASAEMSCFKALGWQFPVQILDLYAEFRNLTNGLPLPAGKGLLGALVYFGEPAMEATKKELMRDLILTCGPWSADEQAAILAYCEADVMALVRLYRRMEGRT
jgi:DNA polymerase I